VGEFGLDYFAEDIERGEQKQFFEAQLKIARDFDLPVVLHARRALDAQSFQQARGALQARQNEVAELKAQLKTFSAKGTARAGREGFRDALIEVVRLHCDEPLWAHLVNQARDLSQARGASHG
jgi:hypothetical protein